MVSCTETAEVQARFSDDYKFTSACAHCGKPMASMSISRIDREPGPLGAFFERDVYVVWIDPEHECTYLSIGAKDKAISA